MTSDDGPSAGAAAKRGRGRDATATRGAILGAARRAFTNQAYDQVGLREIAAEAGIDPALVIRYFGSKEGLFAAAVGQKFDLSDVFDGETTSLGERLARYVLMKPADADHFDPMLAMLRSAPGDEPGRLIRAAIDDGFVGPLAVRLDGPDRAIRAGMIGAVLIGVLISRSVVRSQALTEASPEAVIARLAAIIQGIVDQN